MTENYVDDRTMQLVSLRVRRWAYHNRVPGEWATVGIDDAIMWYGTLSAEKRREILNIAGVIISTAKRIAMRQWMAFEDKGRREGTKMAPSGWVNIPLHSALVSYNPDVEQHVADREALQTIMTLLPQSYAIALSGLQLESQGVNMSDIVYEISKQTGLSANVVRQGLYRFRARVREMFGLDRDSCWQEIKDKAFELA